MRNYIRPSESEWLKRYRAKREREMEIRHAEEDARREQARVLELNAAEDGRTARRRYFTALIAIASLSGIAFGFIQSADQFF